MVEAKGGKGQASGRGGMVEWLSYKILQLKPGTIIKVGCHLPDFSQGDHYGRGRESNLSYAAERRKHPAAP
jgi:hypothetical protein